MSEACPCGRVDANRKPVGYAECCGRYIDHFDCTPAPDAPSLVRSRYTAFVRNRVPSIRATWLAANCPEDPAALPGTIWLGLELRAARDIDADHAEVEYVARYRMRTGRAVRLHERARFIREQGRWLYVDGDMLGVSGVK